MPLNVRKVGRIGGSGTPLLIAEDFAIDSAVARPEWARMEGIVAFAAQPLIFKGQTLGVLAVFSRAAIRQDQFDWLRTFADQAAVAYQTMPWALRSSRSRAVKPSHSA
jgi:hypothetical protein